jgi:hypothetical protein
MTVAKDVANRVRSRAQSRCEYCWMHQSLQGATFHIEHIFPKSLGGESIEENLALACASCNLHKAERTHILLPGTNTLVALFNPRTDRWEDHFYWEQFTIRGKTDVGVVTVVALDLNAERRQFIREAESTLGMFPP